jgi:hypothetical protein
MPTIRAAGSAMALMIAGSIKNHSEDVCDYLTKPPIFSKTM